MLYAGSMKLDAFYSLVRSPSTGGTSEIFKAMSPPGASGDGAPPGAGAINVVKEAFASAQWAPIPLSSSPRDSAALGSPLSPSLDMSTLALSMTQPQPRRGGKESRLIKELGLRQPNTQGELNFHLNADLVDLKRRRRDPEGPDDPPEPRSTGTANANRILRMFNASSSAVGGKAHSGALRACVAQQAGAGAGAWVLGAAGAEDKSGRLQALLERRVNLETLKHRHVWQEGGQDVLGVSATVLRVSNARLPNNTKCTTYVIRVQVQRSGPRGTEDGAEPEHRLLKGPGGADEWKVRRRYSHFKSLDGELRAQLGRAATKR
jgi:hypothetical protein